MTGFFVPGFRNTKEKYKKKFFLKVGLRFCLYYVLKRKEQ